MAALLVEHAAGCGLFRLQEFEEVATFLPQVEESVTDLKLFLETNMPKVRAVFRKILMIILTLFNVFFYYYDFLTLGIRQHILSCSPVSVSRLPQGQDHPGRWRCGLVRG